LFLKARLVERQTMKASSEAAEQLMMPYQRGQQWVSRFQRQAEGLCASLAALTSPMEADGFRTRAIAMLERVGWIAAHRFLLGQVRVHLLGWPRFLAPAGITVRMSGANRR
jgi:hypothetical protein